MSDATEPARAGCPDLDNFAAELVGAIATRSAKDNILVSPFSIATVLGMAALGAELALLPQFNELLKYSGGDLAADLASCVPEPSSNGPTVSFANGLWLRAGISVQLAFRDALDRSFGPSVHELHRQSDIDDWISAATHGKITFGLSDLPSNVALVLANAIFFDGKWAVPFDPRATQPRPFKAGDGTIAEIPTMKRSALVPYREDGIAQGVKLRYRGGPYELLLILPRALAVNADTVLELAKHGWLSGRDFSSGDGTLLVLRFRLDYRGDILNILASMKGGVAVRAPLSNIAVDPPTLAISAILHTARMEFDEAGTQAAAATVAGMRFTSATFPRPKPFHLTIDRPFIIALRNYKTGASLFTGVINRPLLGFPIR